MRRNLWLETSGLGVSMVERQQSASHLGRLMKFTACPESFVQRGSTTCFQIVPKEKRERESRYKWLVIKM